MTEHKLRRAPLVLAWMALQARGLAERRRVLQGGGCAAAASLWPGGAAAAAPLPTWDLGNGVAMPTLALNTVGLTVESTERAVLAALDAGVSHVDFHPGVERDGVARALKRAPRSSLFLTTKVASQQGNPGVSPAAAADLCRRQIDADRRALGVDALDMWLVRGSPNCDVVRSQWAVLEDAQRRGAVRAIGTVNFCEAQLDCLLATADVKPAVNYYMLHVGMGADAHGLRSHGEARGVRTFAYGALGEPGPSADLLADGPLARVAAKYGKSPEEVAVRWLTQIGVAVSARPTTRFGLGVSACDGDGSCAAGLRKRAATFDWTLSKADVAALSKLAAPDSPTPALFSKACNPDLGTGSARDPLRVL